VIIFSFDFFARQAILNYEKNVGKVWQLLHKVYGPASQKRGGKSGSLVVELYSVHRVIKF